MLLVTVKEGYESHESFSADTSVVEAPVFQIRQQKAAQLEGFKSLLRNYFYLQTARIALKL